MATEKFIQQLARKAGRMVKSSFGRVAQIRTKTNATDVVTEADMRSNKMMVEVIRRKFPAHSIISEELHRVNSAGDYAWYIDPLDGTFNFARGIPVFCVLVALAYKQQVKFAVVFDPIADRLYFAKRGHGAWMNGTRIHCSPMRMFENSYGIGPAQLRGTEKIAFKRRCLAQAEASPFWMGAIGCAGMSAAYVAQGSYDWWASFSGGSWDYAAPALLLEEAGCVIATKKGDPWRAGSTSLIAANRFLFPTLKKLVAGRRGQ